jgi:hypothetical protein
MSAVVSAVCVIQTHDEKVLGTLEYKMRFRSPVTELLKWYLERREILFDTKQYDETSIAKIQ